jgi:hypothetical protein
MADPGNIVEFISSKDIWYELRQDAIVAASKAGPFSSGHEEPNASSRSRLRALT